MIKGKAKNKFGKLNVHLIQARKKYYEQNHCRMTLKINFQSDLKLKLR